MTDYYQVIFYAVLDALESGECSMASVDDAVAAAIEAYYMRHPDAEA